MRKTTENAVINVNIEFTECLVQRWEIMDSHPKTWGKHPNPLLSIWVGGGGLLIFSNKHNKDDLISELNAISLALPLSHRHTQTPTQTYTVITTIFLFFVFSPRREWKSWIFMSAHLPLPGRYNLNWTLFSESLNVFGSTYLLLIQCQKCPDIMKPVFKLQTTKHEKPQRYENRKPHPQPQGDIMGCLGGVYQEFNYPRPTHTGYH